MYLSRIWQNLAESGRIWQNLAESGNPAILKIQKPYIQISEKTYVYLAKSGRIWQNLERYKRLLIFC
jgi:hypothetical protein